jgi:hypothetical protein
VPSSTSSSCVATLTEYTCGGLSRLAPPKTDQTRIDANTLEATTTLKGKNTTTIQVVVSSDGKTRTVTQTGTNAQGQATKVSSVYEKQ